MALYFDSSAAIMGNAVCGFCHCNESAKNDAETAVENLVSADPQEAAGGGGAAASNSASVDVVLVAETSDRNRGGAGGGGGAAGSSSSSCGCDCDHNTVLSSTKCGVDADLDALITHIRSLLIKASNKFVHQIPSSSSSSQNPEQGNEDNVTSCTSYVSSSDLSRLRDFLADSANCASDLQTLLPREGGDLVKSAAETVLKGVGKAHWVTAGLLVLAFVLERTDTISSNRKECLYLLDELFRLCKYVKELKQRPPLKERMAELIEESITLAVTGTIMCCSQRRSSWWHQFLGATVDKERLKDLRIRIDKFYRQLVLHVILFSYDAQNEIKFPRQIMYPSHAVGIEEHLKTVVEMLEFESDKKAVAVVLFGFGGIGKTVLGDAVYCSIDIPGYGFSKVKLFENIHSRPMITKVQKQIMDDITDQKFEEPKSETEGQYSLQRLLESTSCFVYIDNVLDAQELFKLLPKRLHTCNKLRLLLTARTSDVADSVPVPNRRDSVKVFEVSSLKQKEGENLLQELLGESTSEIIIPEQELQQLASMCGGVPLRLELVANYIASHPDKVKAMEVIKEEHLRTGGETLALQNLDFFSFAFEGLQPSYREAFLDICAFFVYFFWSDLEDIFGNDTVEALEKRALIKRKPYEYSEGVYLEEDDDMRKVEVHDVILEIARKKYQNDRVTDEHQLRNLLEAFNDNQEEVLSGIKGIVIVSEKPMQKRLQMQAAALDMMSPKLRHFSETCFVAGKARAVSIEIQGYCTCKFPNLISLTLFASSPPLDIHQSPNLRRLTYVPTTIVELSQIPQQVVDLMLILSEVRDENALTFTRTSSAGFKVLPLLHRFTFSYSELSKQMPSGFLSCLSQLRWLCLLHCKKLLDIPDELHYMPNLRGMEIRGCSELKRLPSSLVTCSALRNLMLTNCEGLEELPEGFCGLSSLSSLSINNCKSFMRLPQNFGRLCSLKFLILSGCENLCELDVSFAELPCLEILDLDRCQKLQGQCMELLMRISTLKIIYIEKCPQLIATWEEQVRNEDVKNRKCVY